MKDRLKSALRRLYESGTFRNASLLFLSRSGNSGLTMLFSLLVGRYLSVEDFGVYGQVLGRIVIIQAITEAGLQYSLVRFLAPRIGAGDRADVGAIVRASLLIKFYAFVLVTGLTLLALAAVYFAPLVGASGLPGWLLPTTGPDFLVLGWLILLGGFGMSLLSYLDALLVAHNEFQKLSFWWPTVGWVRIGLLAIFLFSGETLRADHVLFAFALGPYLSVAVYFFFFPASFFFLPADRDRSRDWVSRLIKYNLWIVAASFMSIISDWMEVLMIQDSADAGLYNAARLPLQAFLILLATMQTILLRRFAGLKSPDEFRAVFRRVYLVLVPLAVALLPGFWIVDWAIPAWFGPDFLPSTRVFFILYPNFILRLFFAPLGTALFALDQPRLIAIETGLKMAVGFVANLILIPQYGIFGAAVASWIAQVVGWIFLGYCFVVYFRKGRFPGFAGSAREDIE